MQFNRLKPYRGEPEVRKSVRHKNRPPPIYEEIPNDVETEDENENRPFDVIKPTTAESQAAENRPKWRFRPMPEIVEHGSESNIENASRDESNECPTLPQLTVYETMPEDDSESGEIEQITLRNDETERPLDTDHASIIESQRDSDVTTGRESRVKRQTACAIRNRRSY